MHPIITFAELSPYSINAAATIQATRPNAPPLILLAAPVNAATVWLEAPVPWLALALAVSEGLAEPVPLLTGNGALAPDCPIWPGTGG